VPGRKLVVESYGAPKRTTSAVSNTLSAPMKQQDILVSVAEEDPQQTTSARRRWRRRSHDDRLGDDRRLGDDNWLGNDRRLGDDNWLGNDRRLGHDNWLGGDDGRRRKMVCAVVVVVVAIIVVAVTVIGDAVNYKIPDGGDPLPRATCAVVRRRRCRRTLPEPCVRRASVIMMPIAMMRIVYRRGLCTVRMLPLRGGMSVMHLRRALRCSATRPSGPRRR